MLIYEEILSDLKKLSKEELSTSLADLLFSGQKIIEDAKINSEEKKSKHRKPKHMDELQITC